MDTDQPDAKFYEIADALLGVANQSCDTLPRSRVSAAFLFAASRFNSFAAAAHAGTQQEFAAGREAAVAYFVGEYEKMLRHNLEDFEANFDRYIATKNA